MVISEVAEEAMGGTSGALFSIFFNALAAEFAKLKEDSKVDQEAWSKALEVRPLFSSHCLGQTLLLGRS